MAPEQLNGGPVDVARGRLRVRRGALRVHQRHASLCRRDAARDDRARARKRGAPARRSSARTCRPRCSSASNAACGRRPERSVPHRPATSRWPSSTPTRSVAPHGRQHLVADPSARHHRLYIVAAVARMADQGMGQDCRRPCRCSSRSASARRSAACCAAISSSPNRSTGGTSASERRRAGCRR